MELDIPLVFPGSVGGPFVIQLVRIQVPCNCWHYCHKVSCPYS